MTITITRIEPQKKNKNRFSLFAGDAFLTGISGETMLHYNLHSGDTIPAEILAEIKNLETLINLREQAYRFLARRAHSVQELREKLLNKGYDLKAIAGIVEELKHKNYLNDQDFARILLKDEIQLHKYGPLLLKQKLLAKGIAAAYIDKLLQDFYPDEKQIRNCRYLAQKKLKTLAKKTPLRQKQQLATYLKTKGYLWSTIQPIINRLIQENNDEFE
jgi:regulatory protein